MPSPSASSACPAIRGADSGGVRRRRRGGTLRGPTGLRTLHLPFAAGQARLRSPRAGALVERRLQLVTSRRPDPGAPRFRRPQMGTPSGPRAFAVRPPLGDGRFRGTVWINRASRRSALAKTRRSPPWPATSGDPWRPAAHAAPRPGRTSRPLQKEGGRLGGPVELRPQRPSGREVRGGERQLRGKLYRRRALSSAILRAWSSGTWASDSASILRVCGQLLSEWG
jgi:hypothetical protein